MSELLARLQTAVSDASRIEHELWRGRDVAGVRCPGSGARAARGHQADGRAVVTVRWHADAELDPIKAEDIRQRIARLNEQRN